MTFTEAENAYLASQRLGRRPHRPRRQPPGHAGRLLLQPLVGHDRRDRLHHGHEPEVPQRRVQGPDVGTITFGELLTHRAGFRLDSGLVFETDDAAREQIRQGVQQVDQRVADCLQELAERLVNGRAFALVSSVEPVCQSGWRSPGVPSPLRAQRPRRRLNRGSPYGHVLARPARLECRLCRRLRSSAQATSETDS